MLEIIIQSFLLGLSSGIFCFTYCVPFMAPYLLLEERPTCEDAVIIIKFLIGRLIGYLVFGAVFGYLGEIIDNQTVDWLVMVGMMMLAVVLIISALGFVNQGFKLCLKPKIKGKIPLVMGFLMGINICPPFLMSLGYIFSQGDVLAGIIFFTFFFIATSMYLIPVFFLSFLNRMKEFRLVARVSALVVGVMFLGYGVYSLIFNI